MLIMRRCLLFPNDFVFLLPRAIPISHERKKERKKEGRKEDAGMFGNKRQNIRNYLYD